MPQFIGLGHYARTGKDTFADMLIAECEALQGSGDSFAIFKQSFADEIKSIACQLFGWSGLRYPTYYDSRAGAPQREIVLPAIGKSPRQLWIDLGLAVREHVYEGAWVDKILKTQRDECTVIVIPDVRFPNEVEAIRAAGGVLLKIVRPGVEPGDNRPDRALLNYDGWDAVIVNDSLDSLRAKAKEYAAALVLGAGLKALEAR